MKKTVIALVMVFSICSSNLWSAPVSAAGKIVSEVIEIAAKKSGKVLSPAAKKAAGESLEIAVKKYGDDALEIASHGGLEAIDCMRRYGDDFLRLTNKSPQAARILAQNADELMPIAQRIGPEFMTLETKLPGLGKKAVEVFGDDAVKTLNNLSPDDAAKVIAWGSRADSPRTARLLLEQTAKSNGNILKYLDGKKIMAAGLSTAAIIAASKVSDGVREQMKSSPTAVTWGIWGIAAIIIAVMILIYWGPILICKGWKKAKETVAKK